MKTLTSLLIGIGLLAGLGGCCPTKDAIAKYNPVETVVRDVRDAVFGTYGDSLPATFTRDSLFALLSKQERFHELEVLRGYTLELTPLKGSYVLFVYDGPDFVLFDYGCTPDWVDGPVYRKNTKFFLKAVPCEE